MRAVIYERISRDRTGEEAGVTRQDEDCHTLAKQLGWPVVEVYRDNDISATSGKPRPAYLKLLDDLRGGHIDAIIAWHPDRLYRKLGDLEDLIDAADKANVTFRTVRAGEFDLATGTGRMLARILASIAQGEGELKAERWLRSIRQRREQGQPPGWGPRLYGYTRDHEIEPGEAAHIRDAAHRIIAGESINSVARHLTAAGSRTSKGNPWSSQALKALLSNPRLAGHSTLNGETVGVGTWTPILTDEEFQQVQAMFAVRRGQAAPRARVSLLLGLARCGLCGTPLVSARRSRPSPDQPGRRVYRCPKPPRADGCGRIAVDAENLEEYVEGYVRAKLDDPRVRAALSELAEGAGAAAAEIVALEDRLVELEGQLADPGVPAAAIMRAMDKVRERIGVLQAQAVPPPDLPSSREWPRDLARRARLVRLVVAQVRVGPAERPGRNVFDTARVQVDPVV